MLLSCTCTMYSVRNGLYMCALGVEVVRGMEIGSDGGAIIVTTGGGTARETGDMTGTGVIVTGTEGTGGTGNGNVIGTPVEGSGHDQDRHVAVKKLTFVKTLKAILC